MSYYEFLLFAHISFIAVWLGSTVAIQFFAIRAQAAGPERMGTLLGDVEVFGGRVLAPASGLVFLFGLLMVLDQAAWEFSQIWVGLGMAMFFASAATGIFFLTPESGRIKALIEQHGIGAEVVQARIKRIFLISRVELFFLFVIILVMITKPGL